MAKTHQVICDAGHTFQSIWQALTRRTQDGPTICVWAPCWTGAMQKCGRSSDVLICPTAACMTEGEWCQGIMTGTAAPAHSLMLVAVEVECAQRHFAHELSATKEPVMVVVGFRFCSCFWLTLASSLCFVHLEEVECIYLFQQKPIGLLLSVAVKAENTVSTHHCRYTSLGSMENTHPNPTLQEVDSKGIISYQPAYRLKDGRSERAGRNWQQLGVHSFLGKSLLTLCVKVWHESWVEPT